jgi:hypothetical protein
MSVRNDAATASLARSYGAATLLDNGRLASTQVPAVKECVDKYAGPVSTFRQGLRDVRRPTAACLRREEF